MNKYFELAIDQSLKAYKKKEVPIGAILVKDGKIIAKAHNKRVKSNLVTSHAEIIAIQKAEKKLKDWRLNGCDLYVTLKPCDMCESIIKESRIDNVYYLIERQENKKSYQKTNICIADFENSNNLSEKYKEILKKFFESHTNRSS